VVRPYARHTNRLNDALRRLALEAGGEGGARIAHWMVAPVSADTLLRRIRKVHSTTPAFPRVLGVDDFAFRRGKKYGTILIDHERRRTIDLLPDREAETLTQWLKDHPGIEIVTRARSLAYTDAINRGAPDAVQIADRWHIIVRRLTRRLIPIQDGRGSKELVPLGQQPTLRRKPRGTGAGC
jgi:transposase